MMCIPQGFGSSTVITILAKIQYVQYNKTCLHKFLEKEMRYYKLVNREVSLKYYIFLPLVV